MKEADRLICSGKHDVAPLVGAWIERTSLILNTALTSVAPLVGAWIERSSKTMYALISSVAPLVGAWIESLILAQRKLEKWSLLL